MLIVLYFMFLPAAPSDHPCLALDEFSTDAVANSRMIKCKRSFQGNSTSVRTLYAGHEKSARIKVHKCRQRCVTTQTLLEFAEQRNKKSEQMSRQFFTLLTTRFRNIYCYNSVFHHLLCFFIIFTFCLFSFRFIF